LPRLLHRYLTNSNVNRNDELLNKILKQQGRYNTLLTLISLMLLGLIVFEIFAFSMR
jgi:hypothetical protein